MIGREFTLSTIQAVTDQPEEPLAEACRAAVLHEHAQIGEVQYRWAHALFRETLYADLPALERTAFTCGGASSGGALRTARRRARRRAWPNTSPTLSPPTTSARRYVRPPAARQATAVYADGEAARLLHHALAIQDAVAPDDAALKCDLLTARGWALNDAGEARRALDEIASLAFGWPKGCATRSGLRPCVTLP